MVLMTTTQPSGAVRAGYGIVTVLLVFTVLFGVLVVVSVGVGIARHGDSLLYGDTLTVPLQLSPDDVGPLPAGVRLNGWPDVHVEIHDPTTKQMLLRSATDFGPLALFIAGLWLLRGFMRSVREGDPFGVDNVRRLRGLGFLLVVGAPLVELINYLIRQALFNEVPPFPSVDLGSAGYALPAGAMIGGLGAFILAEVFAYGARLRDDVEGTI
jgi:Protein of unknown function (DUF2975)